jgi:hypothetical protein
VAARSKACVCGRSLAGIAVSNFAGVMDVCLCECCVLSDEGLCDGLITRSEESYRVWCVTACDLETSRRRGPWPGLGRSDKEKITYSFPYILMHELYFTVNNSRLKIVQTVKIHPVYSVSKSDVKVRYQYSPRAQTK